MKTPFKLLACLLVLASGPGIARAPDEAAKAKLARLIEGHSAGKAVSCISLRDARGTELVGNSFIYRVSRNRFYRNDPRSSCGGYHSDPIFVTRTFGDRLCRGDVVELVDRGSRSYEGHCIMGDFTPYTRNPG